MVSWAVSGPANTSGSSVSKFPHAFIRAFGVTLRRLGHADIEMVRQWRNSDAVSQWLKDRQQITTAMQEVWFNSLDPEKQYYYVIEHDGQKLGLVNIKNAENGSGEGGIFIGDESYQDAGVGTRAMLAMYDFGFLILGLHEITAHILSTNKRAIRVNEAIGAVRDPGQEGVVYPKWRILPDAYWAKTKRLREYWQNSAAP
jgi:RimJ/RimL family protein N-acetyltransferase